MQKYYQTLGISENASLDEVRKAYRKLALKYHPDRNKQVGAAEKFRAISDAYQAIIAYEENGWDFTQTTTKDSEYKTTSDYEYQQQIIRERQEKEEREFAEYMKTDRYKFFYYGEMIAQLLFLLPVLLIFLFFLYKLTNELGVWGLAWSVAVCLMFYGLIMFLRETGRLFPFAEYGKAICFFSTNKRTIFLIPALFSIVVFFKIGMNTFLPTYVLFGAYFLSIAFLVYRLRTQHSSSKRTLIAVAPLMVISILLLINFVFAINTRNHFYIWCLPITNGGKHVTLELKNNPFEKEWHTLLLIDTSIVKNDKLMSIHTIDSLAGYATVFKDNDQVVNFKIADGQFGILVLKEYDFIYVIEN